MSEEQDYECAISGLVSEGGIEDDSDGLDDLPVGWTQITFRRRTWNPKWVTIQAVKEASIEALLSQFPEEIREAQRPAVEVQIEANLHGLEAATPKYLVDEDTVFVSDSEDVADALEEIRETLGISESDEDDEDEDV